MTKEKQQTIILRLPAVKNMTGLPTSTIYYLMAQGDFPRNIKLGKRSVGWLLSDIDYWIQSRAAFPDVMHSEKGENHE